MSANAAHVAAAEKIKKRQEHGGSFLRCRDKSSKLISVILASIGALLIAELLAYWVLF